MTDFGNDDDLLDALGTSLQWGASVPDSMLSFARESHRLLSFESELADIVSDSALEAGASRSANDIRMLQLEAGGHEVALEVTPEGVMGSIVPTTPDRIELEGSDQQRVDVAVNERGFFNYEPPNSSYRLWLHFGSDVIRTTWLR